MQARQSIIILQGDDFYKEKILILSLSILMSLSFVTTVLATPNETSELNKSEQLDTNSLDQVEDYSSNTIPDTCTSEYDMYVNADRVERQPDDR